MKQNEAPAAKGSGLRAAIMYRAIAPIRAKSLLQASRRLGLPK